MQTIKNNQSSAHESSGQRRPGFRWLRGCETSMSRSGDGAWIGDTEEALWKLTWSLASRSSPRSASRQALRRKLSQTPQSSDNTSPLSRQRHAQASTSRIDDLQKAFLAVASGVDLMQATKLDCACLSKTMHSSRQPSASVQPTLTEEVSVVFFYVYPVHNNPRRLMTVALRSLTSALPPAVSDFAIIPHAIKPSVY